MGGGARHRHGGPRRLIVETPPVAVVAGTGSANPGFDLRRLDTVLAINLPQFALGRAEFPARPRALPRVEEDRRRMSLLRLSILA